MKVGLNSLQELLKSDLPATDKLVEKIGAQLGAVEEVVPFGEKFKGVLIVKVVKCEKLEGSDHLSLCRVDDGKAMKKVERGKDGLVQVVCGAPNVRAGLLAAWLPPGSTVPSSIDTDEPFILAARDIRGKKSNGMLASLKELGLGDDHSGILEVDADAKPGTTFIEAYKLTDEAVIDIENKMFTHRPDCFGLLGVAREIAGIQGQPFASPAWYLDNRQPKFPAIGATKLPLTVTNELPKLVPRFTAVTMSSITVKPSPVWLQIGLTEAGIRPINNVVDLTNFWMLQTGQPLHAYDYDKVKAISGKQAAIVVRRPKPREKLKLLSGKEIEPRPEAVMIATDKQLIGLGGVMGGADTEVDNGTKNIILECANFDMYSIRRTAMAQGLFTDAVTRFTKGQSPLQNLAVLAKIAADIQELAGGQVAGPVIDDNHLGRSVLSRNALHPSVSVSVDFINTRLGLKLKAADMKKLLENVEFKIIAKADKLTITAPFWRTDIELPEDIVEEIGRLYGYDHLPLELPKRDLTPAPKDAPLTQKADIRRRLAKAGANELLTYSFVHGDLLQKVGQDKAQAFQVANALSPDLQYYRLSLTPSLLEKVHPNLKAGYDEFTLFELGKAHSSRELDKDGLPLEFERLALVFAANPKLAARQYAGAAYYQAKYYLTELLGLASLWPTYRVVPLSQVKAASAPLTKQMLRPYEPQRSAVIYDKDKIVGVVGEYRASVRQALKLPDYSAGFEFFLSAIPSSSVADYQNLPRFPKVSQDMTLRLPAKLVYAAVQDFIGRELGVNAPDDTLVQLEPVDIFQKDGDKHKNITFRINITGQNRTLTDKQVSAVLDKIADAAKAKLGAERI